MSDSRGSSMSPRNSTNSTYNMMDILDDDDFVTGLPKPTIPASGNRNSRSSFSLMDYSPPPWLRQDESSPSLTGDETPRRSKARPHNLAAFGAKLSSSTGVLSTGLKSKMFRQSKTDLRNLKKKADLALPISDRSPRARTSREIDRIVALSSSPSISSAASQSDPTKKHHKSFLRKDSSAILSSSFSNSKLASEGTLYSFHGPLLQENSSGEKPSFKTKEEAQSYVTSTWSVLLPHLHYLFKEHGLKLPVEDMNTLIRVHVIAHLQSGGTAVELYERLREALINGYRPKVQRLKAAPTSELIRHLAKDWELSYHKIFLQLEAVFMPLQLEIEGRGVAFASEDQAEIYWRALRQKIPSFSVQTMIQTVYRDRVVIPLAPRLGQALLESLNFEEDDGTSVSTIAARVTQCINLMSMLRTGDEYQATVDSLVDTSRESWVTHGRTPKDRRGLILKRPI